MTITPQLSETSLQVDPNPKEQPDQYKSRGGRSDLRRSGWKMNTSSDPTTSQKELQGRGISRYLEETHGDNVCSQKEIRVPGERPHLRTKNNEPCTIGPLTSITQETTGPVRSRNPPGHTVTVIRR